MLHVHAEFGRKLDEDLAKETSGHFRRLLVAQCNADRDQSKVPDPAKAHLDAKDIFEVIFTCVVAYYYVDGGVFQWEHEHVSFISSERQCG